MSTYKFGFPTFLTCYHFLLTLVLLEIMGSLKFFEFTSAVPASSRWSMGFFGVVSIVAMNFNLKMNSIGFYQLSKLCTIPCMVIYKFFGQNQKTPANTLFSLGLLLIGLCLFTVNDVQFNLLGSIIALVAVITTTIYQTQTNVLQRIHAVTGIQLNHAVSLARFVIALIASISIETYGDHNILNHEFHTVEVGLILATGFLAVMGNCVGFSLIGRAGPITFQVVGHVKTMTVFIFGLLMFPPAEEPYEKKIKKIGGLCISMVGVVLYTVFEIRNKALEVKPKALLEMHKEEEDLKEVQPVKTVVFGEAGRVEQG
jgi:solute carrier family 35 protein E3